MTLIFYDGYDLRRKKNFYKKSSAFLCVYFFNLCLMTKLQKIKAKNIRNKKKKFKNLSGLEIAQLYTPKDTKKINYKKDIGLPGEFPYTRGIYPTMYRGKLWTMRQFAGLGSAKETNERFKYLLKHGQMGLSVAFDLPTLMGCDSDDCLSAGEVGWCGVAIDSLDDMETLFKGIPLGKVTTSMTVNAPAAILYAMYIVTAMKQGVKQGQIGGTIQNDMLKEYIAQKEWIYPPKPHLKLITDMITYSSKKTPKWHPISISGYHIREAGSTAVQELAFTLYNGLTYIEEVVKAGLKVDEFAPRLSFFFNSHNDFFEEIAKFRAARRIWAREMKKRYKPKKPESIAMRFHTQTAGCSLIAEQPYNNIVRVAIQALAGVLGGTQSLHTDSMDETLATPTEKAVTIALRTQQIIAHETGVANTVDPLGGSYYIESLTNQMEEETYKYFKKLDKMGGMVAAIKKGFPQKEIHEAAFAYQKEIDKKQRIIVGLNDFISEEGESVETLEIDPTIEERQIERLNNVKKKREQRRVAKALDDLKKMAEKGDNLMPGMIEAVKLYATVGEISNALKEVYGTYEEPDWPQKGKYIKKKKKILISKVGQDGHDRGVKILVKFLRINNFNVVYSGLRKSPEEIVEQAIKENVNILGISILSGAHKSWLPGILKLLNKKGRMDIKVIGGGIIPEQDIPELEAIGLQKVFHPGTPLEEILGFIMEL